MKTLIKFLFTTLILSLVGCGFHLRGIANLPPQLHTMSLESSVQYSQLYNQLKSSLQLSGVNIIKETKDAPVILTILSESLTTRQTSIGSSQQTRNYTATYSVSYDIKDKAGRVIVDRKTISEQQDINLNENEVLTNSNKLSEAKVSMTQNLISKIMFQLSSKEVVESLQRLNKQ